VEARQV